MATESEKARTIGFVLLGSALVLGGISALLYWSSYSEDWNVVPLIIAIGTSLGTVLLIGFGIKKFADAAE